MSLHCVAMSEPVYSLYLTLRRAGKTLPYPAADRVDSRNYGFMPLKGHPERVSQVPEAQTCPGLAQALQRLNAAGTALYTAGCDYSLNTEGNGSYWTKGYIDCVFMDPQRAGDCHAYFALFRAFATYLGEQGYEAPIDFHWELEQVDFIEDGYSGWTICLWVTTDFYGEAGACQAHWDAALELFCSFIEQVNL